MNVKLTKKNSKNKYQLIIEPSIDIFETPFDIFDSIEFITWHRRYNLGNVSSDLTPEEFAKLHSEKVVRKVYMLDHTFQTLSLRPFNDPWDSGFLGLIAADNEEIINDFINCYNRYLHNEVYDLIVEETTYCQHCKYEHTEIVENISGLWEEPEDILQGFLDEFSVYEIVSQ